jgi:hypothetical protein
LNGSTPEEAVVVVADVVLVDVSLVASLTHVFVALPLTFPTDPVIESSPAFVPV